MRKASKKTIHWIYYTLVFYFKFIFQNFHFVGQQSLVKYQQSTQKNVKIVTQQCIGNKHRQQIKSFFLHTIFKLFAHFLAAAPPCQIPVLAHRRAEQKPLTFFGRKNAWLQKVSFLCTQSGWEHRGAHAVLAGFCAKEHKTRTREILSTRIWHPHPAPTGQMGWKRV